MKRLVSYILLPLLLCTATGVRADNIIYVSTTEGQAGEEVTVSIGIDNSDAVSSLQVTIPLEGNMTVVDGSGKPTNRCPNHVVTIGEKDGELQLFVYSNNMENISGNTGAVATFKLKLGNVPGGFTLQPSKTVAANADGQTVASRANGVVQTISGAQADYSWGNGTDLGGIPIGEKTRLILGVTNIGNADLVINGMTFSDVNSFSTDTKFPITIKPGESAPEGLSVICDPKNRNAINQTIKIDCNSSGTNNTIRVTAQPYVINTLTVGSASGVSDEEVTISLTMRNEDPVSGYQVEFDMPESLLYVDGSFTLSDRKQDHTAAVSLDGTMLRILVYSSDDKPFTGHDGEIGSFKVKLNGRKSTDLTPTKVVLSATINNVVEDVTSTVNPGYVTIVCPYIEGEDKIDFWRVPITQVCSQWYLVKNSGYAPLIISQIVFDNKDFSVGDILKVRYEGENQYWDWMEEQDKQLPLEIPIGEERVIQVKYNSIVEKDFEAVMQIHSNDAAMRLKEVKLTGNRFAPNYLHAITSDVAVGQTPETILYLDNYDPINGVQFDFVCPSEFRPLTDNDINILASADGMEVIVNKINERTTRFIFYFPGGGAFPKGCIKLMTLKLASKPGEMVPEGQYNYELKNIKLGTADMENKFVDDYQQWFFNVKSQLLLGDADNDGLVDRWNDVWIIAQYLMCEPWAIQNLQFNQADVNQDGIIDVADIVKLTNMALEAERAGQ